MYRHGLHISSIVGKMAYYAMAYSTRATIENTKHFTKWVVDTHIPGALVECGVAAGAQIAAMQDALRDSGEKRWIYGFDSFEGIPLASEEDAEQPGIPGPRPNIPYTDKRELLKTSGITVHRKGVVQANLNAMFPSAMSTTVLVEGWFQDTLHQHTSALEKLGGIALLRLDGDLYESTKVSLEQLFPLLNSGGILIVDDWELSGCRLACDEYFASHPVSRLTEPYISNPSGPAYFTKA